MPYVSRLSTKVTVLLARRQTVNFTLGRLFLKEKVENGNRLTKQRAYFTRVSLLPWQMMKEGLIWLKTLLIKTSINVLDLYMYTKYNFTHAEKSCFQLREVVLTFSLRALDKTGSTPTTLSNVVHNYSIIILDIKMLTRKGWTSCS